MTLGIVGHEAAKFTPDTEAAAKAIIRYIIDVNTDEYVSPIVVSGGCHLGGVDIRAVDIARRMGVETHVHLPKTREWAGYKARNLLIARDSDEVHVIVVARLPDTYTGMRFKLCYHCNTDAHIKSGACWTARQAIKLGKTAVWHVV